MKKRFIISVISSCMASIIISAQVSKPINMAEKLYTCFVKIETTSGEKMEAALERLTADSVFIAAVEDKYVKAGGHFIKILREETETGIAVDQIKSFKIKYEPNIINSNELNKREKKLKRQNAGKIVGITLLSVVTIATLPLAAYGGGGILDPLDFIPFNGNEKKNVSVTGNNLLVSKKYQSFTLNGDNEQYIKMVKRLTKSNRDPFKNNLAKN